MLTLLVVGCAPRPSMVSPSGWTSDALLQKVQGQSGAIQTLKGMARLKVKGGGQSRASSQALLISRPDLLRADVLSPFGQTLLQVAVRNGVMTAFATGKKEAYRGQASAENLYRFTRVPLNVQDLIALTLYDVPLVSDEASGLEQKGEQLHLWLDNDTRQQELLFDLSGRLTGTRYYQEGTLFLDVAYDEFFTEEMTFPRKLRIALPLEDAVAEVAFRKVQLNQTIETQRFTLNLPATTEIQELDY